MFRFFENLLDPYPETFPARPPRSFFAFLWACTEGARRYLGAMLFLTAGIGAFEALLFAMMGHIVDWLSHVPAPLLWTRERGRLLALAAVLVASPLLVALQTIIKHQVLAGNLPMRLRWNFHRLMLAQSMSFYQDEFAGRVAAKVMHTALAVRDVLVTVADVLAFLVIYFGTSVAVVGKFDRWMLLPFWGWVILYAVALRYFIPRLGRVGRAQANARSLMTGRIADAYANIATVKLFSHAGREASYARGAMRDFIGTVHRQMRLVSGFEIVNHLLGMALCLTVAGAALWLWTEARVGIGAVAAATALALRLNSLSHWMMWEMTALFEQIGTVQDGIDTLSCPHPVPDRPNAPALRADPGELHFKQVGFAYGGVKPVLDRFDLHVRPGERIGLVGRSGAGKSTVVNLLLRFYDVEAGCIMIDGVDIGSIDQDSLRARIGVVTQDTALLHRSVRENLLYGRPDASEAEMIAAAKRAEAHDFIQTLIDAQGRAGYDAHVGERGVKLSGGQRQRIAIARVMLKNAPILVLDEATSALDSEVEAGIQSSLYRLMEGKTVLAIAHRLSTIAAMDRLIVLDHGRVVEQGNHHSLLANGGLYAKLWAHQSGGFLGEDTEELAAL